MRTKRWYIFLIFPFIIFSWSALVLSSCSETYPTSLLFTMTMTVPTEKSPAVAVLIKTNSNLSDDWLVIKSVDDNHKVATVKNLNIVIDVAKINNHWDIMIATICAYNIQKSVGLQGSRDILCSVAKRSDLLNPSFHVITFNYELTE